MDSHGFSWVSKLGWTHNWHNSSVFSWILTNLNDTTTPKRLPLLSTPSGIWPILLQFSQDVQHLSWTDLGCPEKTCSLFDFLFLLEYWNINNSPLYGPFSYPFRKLYSEKRRLPKMPPSVLSLPTSADLRCGHRASDGDSWSICTSILQPVQIGDLKHPRQNMAHPRRAKLEAPGGIQVTRFSNWTQAASSVGNLKTATKKRHIRVPHI